MILTIINIQSRVVICQLDNETIIEIGRRWFTEDIMIGDKINVEIFGRCIKNKEKG